MIFRGLLFISFALIVASPRIPLGLDSLNAVEKGTLLLTTLIFIATRPRIWRNILIIFVVFMLIIINGLLSRNPDLQWSVLLNALNQFMIPFGLLSAIPTERDRMALLKVAAWAPLACCLVASVYQAAGLYTLFTSEYGTGIGRLRGTMNPAFLSGFALIGCVASITMWSMLRQRTFLLFLINFSILLLAGGRMPLLIGIVICVWLFFQRKSDYTLLKQLTLLSVPWIMTAVALSADLFARFGSSGLSGRDLMWEHLLEMVRQYQDFGVGFGQSMLLIPSSITMLTGSAAAHNDYLRFAAELGIFGAILFYALMLTVTLTFARRTSAKMTLVNLGIIGYAAYSITDNVLASPSDFFLLIVCCWVAVDVRNEAPILMDSSPGVAARHS